LHFEILQKKYPIWSCIFNKAFISFVFLTFQSLILHSQIYFRDHGSTTDSAELKEIIAKSGKVHDSLFIIKKSIVNMTIVAVKDKKYLLPDGRFDVFEWRKGNWVNLYNFFHHGYNYGGYKFVFNDEIYSCGGYGFWRQHGELIKFLWDRNEWEIVTYGTGDPEGLGYMYYFDGNLFVIDPISINDTKKTELKTGKSFKIDLKTLKKSEINISFKTRTGDVIETENFWLRTTKPTYLIDKRNGKLYFNNLTCFEGFKNLDFRNKMFFYIKNDQVNVYDFNQKLILKFDIESELKGFEPMKQTINPIYYFLATGIIVIFLALAGWLIYIKRKRKITTQINGNNHSGHQYINDLMLLSGKTITVEELDSILGLDGIINAETQRYKRSSIINAINLEMQSSTGKKLIMRIQDPEDKRRFLYEVNGK
jgi:hypothetical protein